MRFIIGFVVMLMLQSSIFSAMKTDCVAIRYEAEIFKKISPSGLLIYRDQLAECDIFEINSLNISDYFKTEYDTLLTLSYIAIDQRLTHPSLLAYMIRNERWDLLLSTLDTVRLYERGVQIKTLNYLFYKDLPHYFNVELKEMFNFFSAPEKIAVSQQLIPSNANEVKHLNKRNNYIYEFWPLFDQMVFINHLRELYPYQFEKLAVFWREKLVSYYYDGIEKQDPSFKVLSNLLNRELVKEPVVGANPSIQVFYYLKLNEFDKASESLQVADKSVFFNVLRYFELFDSQQKNYLMRVPIQFSITDIKRLFNAYYFQLEDPTFRKWVWKIAIDNRFNCETYLKAPYLFLRDLPYEYRQFLSVLSPISDAVNRGRNNKDHLYENDPTDRQFPAKLNKNDVAYISRFYNEYKKVPFKDRKKVISTILPFIKIASHQQYLDLLPYLSLNQQLDLIERFDELEKIPTKNRAEWSRWVQPRLSRLSEKKSSPPKKTMQKETLPLSNK